MSPRERVINSLQFRESDIVPYHIDFTQPAYEKMVEYYGDPDVGSKVGNHILELAHKRKESWVEIKPGFWKDEFGVVWNRTVDKDIGVVEELILREPTLDGYTFPDTDEPGIFDHYPTELEKNSDRFSVSQIGFSLFERAWTLRGMENLLMDMIENPEFVHELLDAICDYNLRILDRALQYPVDACYFGDDWGSQRGLIMGEERWREFILPRLRKMYGKVRDAGKFVMIHSCGKVQSIFPDLIDAGLNLFNPFQPEVMDPYEMKKLYHGKLAFNGGISIQQLLPYGTPDEVRAETRRLLKEVGAGGGYIAGPSHALPGDVPTENIVAMVEVFQNQ